jgi:hypothetical protein
LHLDAAALCASAESLMRIPASRKGDMEVTESLLLYAHDAAAVHGALARKWLGAEKGAQEAHGMAVGFLGWAKRELDALRDSRARKGGKEDGRDERRERRGHIATEAEDVAQFLRYYTRMNDTVRALRFRKWLVVDCPWLLVAPPVVVSAGAVARRAADQRAGRSSRRCRQGIRAPCSCVWPWLGRVYPQACGLPRSC